MCWAQLEPSTCVGLKMLGSSTLKLTSSFGEKKMMWGPEKLNHFFLHLPSKQLGHRPNLPFACWSLDSLVCSETYCSVSLLKPCMDLYCLHSKSRVPSVVFRATVDSPPTTFPQDPPPLCLCVLPTVPASSFGSCSLLLNFFSTSQNPTNSYKAQLNCYRVWEACHDSPGFT